MDTNTDNGYGEGIPLYFRFYNYADFLCGARNRLVRHEIQKRINLIESEKMWIKIVKMD
jgi:hypothetical protein